MTRWNRQLRGQPCTLAANRIFHNLNHNLLPFVNQLADIRLGPSQVLRPSVGLFVVAIGRPVTAVRYHVCRVQKGGALEAGINESSLHTGQYPHDLSLVDIADNTAAAAALYMHFLQAAVLDHRYPDFLGRHIDQQLFTHCIFPFCRQRGQIPTAANSPAVSQSGKPITAE